jgi:hypothetical protein
MVEKNFTHPPVFWGNKRRSNNMQVLIDQSPVFSL